MCKCLCQMKCNCEREQDILGIYTKELEDSKRNRRVNEEYATRNIPMILELVRKYNDILKQNPETENDARKKQELQVDLARQIVAYVGI